MRSSRLNLAALLAMAAIAMPAAQAAMPIPRKGSSRANNPRRVAVLSGNGEQAAEIAEWNRRVEAERDAKRVAKLMRKRGA